MNEEFITIYAIVPSKLYKTKELTSEEKLLAERITALCKNKGHAWVTNKTLANMYGIREDTVSKHIKKLEKYGFIKCEYNWTSETKSKRVIHLTEDIWDKYNESNSINELDDIDYMNEHNIKDNNK